MTEPVRKNHARTLVIALLLLAVAAWAFLWARRHGIGFDVHSFARQLHNVSWLHIAAGVLLIYASFLIRSYRWAVLVARQRRLSPLFLLGSQFTGFTAVALFGRIADLSRPYLIARKAQLSLPSQIAVYTVERMFDLGAAALIFSSALAFTPANMPHHEVFVHVGVASLAGTIFLAVFAIVLRVGGERVAALLGSLGGKVSPKLGALLTEKVLAFREGLLGLGSPAASAWAAVLSLVQWWMIAQSYVEVAHAFRAEPTLAHISFASTMLLMGASIGSSLLQLPVVGWFTQIGATAASMHGFYGTPLETATACGALLLCVNLLSVIPPGLLYAKIDGVRLSELAARSEAAAEEVPA